MSTIAVTNLGKAYKQYPTRWSRLAEWTMPWAGSLHTLHWVLRDISFQVAPGEAVGIIGINGAGKSTLLKMITGTTQPTTGSVHIIGRVAAMLDLGMGFHPDFTGRQNAFMAGQLLGYSVDEIARLMPEIEAFAEIGNYIDQPVRVYSSGMQMRLGFSVATARRPDVLIVDEVLVVGDVYFQSKCYARINEYKKEGMTLLFVSHAVMDVVKQCNRSLFIDDGQITFDGASRDAANLYMDKMSRTKRRVKQPEFSAVADGMSKQQLLSSTKDIYHEKFGYRKEEYRWGNGGARIVDYLIVVDNESYPKIIEANSIIQVYFSVVFDEDIEFVTPGILIKTLEGILVYGSNSHIASNGNCVLHGKKRDAQLFKFTFQIALNEGTYLLSLGVSKGDPTLPTEPIDRRYDSIIINIKNPVHMWGIIDLHAEFEVCNNGD